MQQYNIQEAKTHLSSLIDSAIKGKPVVKVVPYSFKEPNGAYK